MENIQSKLIELNKKILETEKIKISFKETFFSKPVIVSFAVCAVEIILVIFAYCNSDCLTVIKSCTYSIMVFSTCHLIYLFYNCFHSLK